MADYLRDWRIVAGRCPGWSVASALPARRPFASLFSLPLVDGSHVAFGRTRIELSRPPDLLLRVADHLVPLRDPADGPGERKDAGEHAVGDAQRALHDAGVEIHIGIELALDEIVVLDGDFFQRHRQ